MGERRKRLPPCFLGDTFQSSERGQNGKLGGINREAGKLPASGVHPRIPASTRGCVHQPSGMVTFAMRAITMLRRAYEPGQVNLVTGPANIRSPVWSWCTCSRWQLG